MSKRDNRKARKAAYEKERAQASEFRRMGELLKPALRELGCDLPFYEGIDDYRLEFRNEVDRALRQFPTLVGVHEISKTAYLDPKWETYSMVPDQQVFFDFDDRFESYGKIRGSRANIQGSTTFFLDSSGTLSSVVLIPPQDKSSNAAVNGSCGVKLGILLHELGHVHDAENGINIDPRLKRMDIIEAEAFANCYALNALAARCCRLVYDHFYSLMENLTSSKSFEGEIGRLVLEQHPRQAVPSWRDYEDEAQALALSRLQQKLSR